MSEHAFVSIKGGSYVTFKRAVAAGAHLTCGPVTLTLPHEHSVRVTSPTIIFGEPAFLRWMRR